MRGKPYSLHLDNITIFPTSYLLLHLEFERVRFPLLRLCFTCDYSNFLSCRVFCTYVMTLRSHHTLLPISSEDQLELWLWVCGEFLSLSLIDLQVLLFEIIPCTLHALWTSVRPIKMHRILPHSDEPVMFVNELFFILGILRIDNIDIYKTLGVLLHNFNSVNTSQAA